MSLLTYWQALRGSVICVKKGFFTHKGIVHSAWLDELGQVVVCILDNSPGRNVAYRSIVEFSGGNACWIERSPSNWFEANQVISRAESRLGEEYDAWNFNCQDFVNFTYTLKHASEDRTTLVVLGLAGVFAAVLTANTSRR